MMSDDFDLEMKACFLEEAEELVSHAEQSILKIKESGADKDTLEGLCRALHNLKGSGQAVGFNQLGQLSHKIENLVVGAREGRVPFNQEVISVLLHSIDELVKLVAGLAADISTTKDFSEIENDLSNALDKDYSSSTSADVSTEEVKVLPEVMKPSEVKEPKIKENSSDTKKPSDEVFRVRVSKLDKILDSVGELVIHQNMLIHSTADMKQEDNVRLFDVITQLTTIVKELQTDSFTLRMVPIKGIFQKMRRVVHDISDKLGKDINLDFSGEHIELDKTILDAISDPLTHLLRNAVDHGIESNEKRKELNKTRKAKIKVTARQETSNVTIIVKDNGAGINIERVIEKAIESGIITTAEGMTNKEICNLIFNNGFSTKEEVSDVSGRGVGMDVVKSNIEKVGGSISIDSAQGKGTTFRINLPLSLAIIDGMICDINDSQYIIPVTQMFETLMISPSQLGSFNEKGYIVNVRGEEIPLYSLNKLLFGGADESVEKSFYGIITKVDNKKYLLRINKLIGIQQIVIKPLGKEFSGYKGLAGSAVLGDGGAGLIIDLRSLLKHTILGDAA